MTGADIDCATIAGLRWRWLDGELAVDREAYEQHLLYCPPCLAATVNGRTALRALAEAGRVASPPADLVELLTATGPTAEPATGPTAEPATGPTADVATRDADR